MIDRIIGFFSSSPAKSTKSAEPELKVECFECRMVGGGGLTALGGYIIYYAFQKRNQPIAGRLTMFASSFLGSVVMTLGLLRLAGLHDIEPAKANATTQKPKVTAKVDSEILKD